MDNRPNSFYGIDFSDKLKVQPPKNWKNKLKKLSFYLLCSDLPVVKAKKIIDSLKQLSDAKIEKLLTTYQVQHQQFTKLWRTVLEEHNLHLYKAQQDQIKRLEDWVGHFGPLSSGEIREYADLFDLEKRDVDNLQNKINYWVYHSPARIKAYLDEYVVGQEGAKKMVCWAFYNHLLRTGKVKPQNTRLKLTDLPKSNILLLGPSGSGKTYTINTLAKLFGLPLIKVDCASLVSSGYVGKNLSDTFSQLVKASPGGIREAEKGIVFFDEWDKIASSLGSKRSVGGTELQTEFLSIIQKGTYTFNERHSHGGYHKNNIKTDNILFIFGGAFSGIEDIAAKRLDNKQIGFNGNVTNSTPKTALKAVNHEDLVGFGLLPELVNRVSYIALFDSLNKAEILKIMKDSKESVLDEFKAYFKAHNKRLIIKEEVYEAIAEKVEASGKGARQINNLLLALFRDVIFDLPDAKEKTFTFTKEDLTASW